MMRPFFIAILLLTALVIPARWANARSPLHASLTLAPMPEGTRLILQAPGDQGATVTPPNRSGRLVITLRGVETLVSLPSPPANDRCVSALHTRSRNRAELDLVVELRKQNRCTVSTTQEGRWPFRVDLIAHAGVNRAGRSSVASPTAQNPERERQRLFVVAIDAGHGGIDSGAIGPQGTLEKDVVLAIAKRLALLLGTDPGIRPVLIRDEDEFIDLRERMELARKARADLFVSLHADADLDGHAKGASVFTLSRNGASSEAARRLAERENAADRIGGVTLHDKDEVLAAVLLDLTQNATIEASDRAAVWILSELERACGLRYPAVQKAGFVVLKSPDVPSILVEAAFISNPDEELKLRGTDYREQIARALANGIRAYFRNPRSPLPAEPPVQATQAANDPETGLQRFVFSSAEGGRRH
jgi:N-acetylmuramoyl-L-alanine amidase